MKLFKNDTPNQKAWYFYDWANSAYVTTTTTVLFGPYLTSVAQRAAGCDPSADVCENNLDILGLSIAPGSLYFYLVTFTTLLSAFLLPVLGAYADQRPNKQKLLGRLAWIGAAAASLMFFVSGTNWQLGVVLLIVGNLALGASLVVYDAIMIEIASPDERNRVSSKGWAFGYVGGGTLLIVNLGLTLAAPAEYTELAVRVSLLSAGLWWGLFTLIPYFKIKSITETSYTEQSFNALKAGSFKQLYRTLKELSKYPQTRMFLIAYLFFNDGVQTVIASASVYGAEELRLTQTDLVGAIVVVQIVAFVGAISSGRVAARIGGFKTVFGSLFIWAGVIFAGFFLPAESPFFFFLLAALIGFVLGGTQALSRSLFSQLVPERREAEYFALYQAMERGTSWLGTLTFGLAFQFSGSYRPGLLALLAFFLIGGFLLTKVNMREGIDAAGNKQPQIV